MYAVLHQLTQFCSSPSVRRVPRPHDLHRLRALLAVVEGLAALSVRVAGEAGARRRCGGGLVRLDGLDGVLRRIVAFVLLGRRRLVLVGTESLGKHDVVVSAAAE